MALLDDRTFAQRLARPRTVRSRAGLSALIRSSCHYHRLKAEGVSLGIMPSRALYASRALIVLATNVLDSLPVSRTAEKIRKSSANGRDVEIENPCVGGSIPPRATKNISARTPTHRGWRFCFHSRQPSWPVCFRRRSATRLGATALPPYCRIRQFPCTGTYRRAHARSLPHIFVDMTQ